MTAELKEWSDEFFCDLHELSGFEFPLTCPSCNKVFDNIRDFIESTSTRDNLGGIIEGLDDNMMRIIEIIRYCECGNILLEEFSNRRACQTTGFKIRIS